MTTNTKDGITIRIMTEEDYIQVKPFMREQFWLNGEPLSASSGEDVQKCLEKENDEYHISMINEGTCLLATDEKQNGRIVGIVMAGGQYPSDLKKHQEEAATMENHFWGRANRLLSKLELEANVYKRFGVNRSIYSHITNVDESMRGKGLGSRLAATLMEVGRSKGFPLMIAYCTSYYSAKQKNALGMECVHSITYADYKDEKGNVIFKPAAPHTKVQLMAIKL
ncbi:arylalkylamine N-acetyltransferase-like 2 [Drosophila tropicalis]|uniref:arylalkylamine N-acetyltransferase-like 2 n=1 Tax=Drosophila tropicalis TaxID=46794 RepID=UPI0035ABD49E